MKLTNRLTSLLIVAMLAVVASSCSKNDDDPDIIPDNVCYDFVTFVGSNNSGSTFEFRKSGDSALITLTSTAKIDASQLTPGTRVIIQYVPSGGQSVYESGPITLYGIAQITNGSVNAVSLSDIKDWTSDPIRLITLSRSGLYFDVWAEAYLTSNPKRFTLVADAATLADAYPTLYLIVSSDNANGRVHQLYGSFDISSVWNLSTCKGVNVYFKTSSGEDFMHFDKDGQQSIKPAE